MPFEQMIGLFYEHKDTIENMSRNYHSLDHLYHKYPYADTIEVLNFLIKRKFILGLVTSMTKESVIADMEESGIPYKKFEFLQGSKESKFHKPDPRVFRSILGELKKMKIAKNKVLYIGDDIRDMQASMGAGIHFAAIPNGLTKKEEFTNKGVLCLSSLSDLTR